MKLFTLERTQRINWDIARTWRFFSDPHNLASITPPSLDFVVTSKPPPAMYPGLLLSYTVRPFLGLPVTWVTEITQVQAPFRFIDEQRHGPYRIWHHEHTFTEAEDGKGTIVNDMIQYGFACAIVDEILEPLMIAPRLKEIFDFRAKKVEELTAMP